MIYDKYINIFLILINLLNYCECYYDICIVGASSGLGKELVYQSLNKKLKVLALTNNLDDIKELYREGGVNNNYENPIIINKNLKIENYDKDVNYFYDYKNLVFTSGSLSINQEYLYFLINKYLTTLSTECKSINLVTDYDDYIHDTNSDITIMKSFYLKKIYEVKNKQEELIVNYNRDISKIRNPYYLNKVLQQNKILKKNIYRPSILRYNDTIFNGQTKENLAQEIIDNIIF